ncbi:hypothetical protein MSG28_016007 [Choristoneura fumiferana]|uniref:Uncharacterized protein n=1 Tax=Choristoneura fumiferana TaxID=7141 RepID=A0ACC0K546_CHOFU|nr:hypothetical protein MSG28_016007 [Choristoneura fumiferana]
MSEKRLQYVLVKVQNASSPSVLYDLLTLLALRIATSTSLPAPAPGSDGKAKVSRRREQHKDLESHLLESHEWSPQDSELERILDPVSLEDPEDIELKKAIAQLLKEVADREEKRRHKQHHDINRGNSKASDEKVPHEDVNISTEHEHQELKTSQDNLSDDVENHDEIDDHVDSAIDKIEDSNDTEFRSSSIDVDEDLKLSDEDLESTESDLDDLDSRISHEPRIAPKKEELLKHDDHHDEKHTVHHDNDGDLKHKDNHHNQHRHVSKETIEKETDDENHHVNIDNITLEQSLDSISGDKSEELEHGVDSEEEAKPKNGNNHKHHTYERSSYQQHNIDGEISHENEKILKNKAQEDDQSHQDHGNDIKTEQKDNKIHKDSQNENSYEDISDLENHDEENDDDESDQTEELEDYQDSNSRLYSFENYDILNEDSDENQHPKDQAQKTSSRHSDELSSEDDNDFTISHRSHDDSKGRN